MAEAQPIDLTNTSDEDDPPPKRQREDDPPLTRQPDEDDPPPKRQRGGAGSSAPGAWHPAVRAQVAGAQLELPDGSSIERTGVSAKALICLDRLAVLYGSLRAAYDKGYRWRWRTPYSGANVMFRRWAWPCSCGARGQLAVERPSQVQW